MLTVYSPEHIFHAPLYQFEGGRLEAHSETPERAFALLEAAQSLGAVQPPEEFGMQPLLAVHSPDYLEFLEQAYERWVAQGNDPAGVLPHTFASRHTLPLTPSPSPEGGGGQSNSPLPLREGSGVRESLKHKPGYYAFDTSTPVTAGTWQAARAAANVALSGAKLLLGGERCVYTLCRPPGHHAGRELYGGYCYLNNAAIAAQRLVEQGRQRVAILDIDLHHGNGTQQIFYHRSDVLFVSIHVDPATHYPHFSGYAHEMGAGEGLGHNLNIPLPAGTGDAAYLEALAQALAAVRQYAPGYLVVSLGLDTYREDTVGGFALSSESYAQIGRAIAGLGLPTLWVQEGGYHPLTLGRHLEMLLKEFN